MTGGEGQAAGWLLGKLAGGLGGLSGGLSLAMFWLPRKLQEKGKIASVMIAGGISTMVGFAFTSFVAKQLGFDDKNIDVIIGLSWALGMLSIACMNWAGNTMSRTENLDIGEVSRKINAARKGEQAPPMRAKPRVRKTAISRAVATKTTDKPRGAKA